MVLIRGTKRLLTELAMVFGVTRDRRLLGSLNELVFHLTYYIAAAGGLAKADLSDAIRRVNETPMTLINDSPDRAIRRQFRVGPYD